jgi:hypothetical protein
MLFAALTSLSSLFVPAGPPLDLYLRPLHAGDGERLEDA